MMDLLKPMKAVTCAGALLLALGVHGAGAASLEELPSVDELKSQYLACDARTRDARPETSVMQWCAVIGEELLRRGFADDLVALIAWWHAAASAQPAVPGPALNDDALPVLAAQGEAGPSP